MLLLIQLYYFCINLELFLFILIQINSTSFETSSIIFLVLLQFLKIYALDKVFILKSILLSILFFNFIVNFNFNDNFVNFNVDFNVNFDANFNVNFNLNSILISKTV